MLNDYFSAPVSVTRKTSEDCNHHVLLYVLYIFFHWAHRYLGIYRSHTNWRFLCNSFSPSLPSLGSPLFLFFGFFFILLFFLYFFLSWFLFFSSFLFLSLFLWHFIIRHYLSLLYLYSRLKTLTKRISLFSQLFTIIRWMLVQKYSLMWSMFTSHCFLLRWSSQQSIYLQLVYQILSILYAVYCVFFSYKLVKNPC